MVSRTRNRAPTPESPNFFSFYFVGTREANASAQYGPSSNLVITFESNYCICQVLTNTFCFWFVFDGVFVFYQFGFCLEALTDLGSVGEEALLIFGVSQLGEQLLHILLGDLITQVGQQVLKLSNHHGAVAVFVVQLQQLNVVVVVARGVGGILGLGDLGDNVVKLGELLALLISLS